MQPWSTDEFTAQLRDVGKRKYHDQHPFHHLMNTGRLNREQLQMWVANRFYYQKNIPIKDALLLSRCPVREVRRRWIQRILDHDGFGDDPGGIEKWLKLAEATGLDRGAVERGEGVLPGTRYAVGAYVGITASVKRRLRGHHLSRQLGSPAQAALLENVLYVTLDRQGTDIHRLGDFLVGLAARDQLHNLYFAGRETLQDQLFTGPRRRALGALAEHFGERTSAEPHLAIGNRDDGLDQLLLYTGIAQAAP